MKVYYSFLSILLVTLISCQPAKNDKTQETKETPATPTKYTLTPFEPSPEYKDAGFAGLTFNEGKFDIKVAGDSYVLGQQTSDATSKMCANSEKGQHVHIIIDDQPYAAKYESSFDFEIADGKHYFLSFLSRSYHESIKSDKARVAFRGTFENNTLKQTENIGDPMLFYSRPKGTYVGDDTKKVMLDFYLLNSVLGNDTKVKVNINGEIHVVDNWQPYYITGLEMGENTIELTLIDGKGEAIATPLNPVSRTFSLKENAEAAM